MLAVVLALVLASWAIVAPAHAATFGQIGNAWGKPGVGTAQFSNSVAFGVDPVDGSVYGVDLTADRKNFRVQKLSPTGEFQASALVPREITVGTETRFLGMHGIAVDHARKRFYLLQSCRNPVAGVCKKTGVFKAERVLAFNTEPTGKELVLTAEIPIPTVTGEDVVSPQMIAVDSASGGFVLSGEDAEGHALIERVSSSGALAARFVDTTNRLTPEGLVFPAKARSIAVATDGTVYMISSGLEGTTGDFHALTKGWRLPKSLTALEEIPQIAAAAASEGWADAVFPQSTEMTNFFGAPQLAISPNGTTLYWKEELPAESSGKPSAVVRGFSLTTGGTSVVYGGGKGGRCEIQSFDSALATTGERLIVFDYINNDGAASSPEEPLPEGRNAVITFGPGGDGCGGQDVRFTVDGSAEGPVQVEQGAPVELDASESVLVGQVEELEWEFGDGSPKVVVPGPGPSMTMSHVFEKATEAGETFAVTLKVRVKGAPVAETSVEVEVTAAQPTPPKAFIEVLEPAGFSVPAGGTMRFDASQSWDPIAGSNDLKKYVWSFGDGSPEVATTQPTVLHAFENPSGSPLQRLVVLTVESASGGTDSDRRLITVLATPGLGPVSEALGSVTVPTGSSAPQPKTGKKPETAKQRRPKAIAKCRKLPAGSKKRRSCVKHARQIGKGGGKKNGSAS